MCIGKPEESDWNGEFNCREHILEPVQSTVPSQRMPSLTLCATESPTLSLSTTVRANDFLLS